MAMGDIFRILDVAMPKVCGTCGRNEMNWKKNRMWKKNQRKVWASYL